MLIFPTVVIGPKSFRAQPRWLIALGRHVAFGVLSLPAACRPLERRSMMAIFYAARLLDAGGVRAELHRPAGASALMLPRSTTRRHRC
jgi:hypothetical protein